MTSSWHRLWWVVALTVLSAWLSTAGPARAQECSAESRNRQALDVTMVNVHLDSLRAYIAEFFKEHGRVPQSWAELREYQRRADETNFVLPELDGFFVPGAYMFGYKSTMTPDWVVTLEPSRAGYAWIQLAEKGIASGPDKDSLAPVKGLANERVATEYNRFYDEVLPAALGAASERNRERLFYAGLNLFLEQAILSVKPDLAPKMLNTDGIIANLSDSDQPPDGYHIQVRGTRDTWQVVGWPVTYGPETPVSVCFESDGDIKVGDAKGSDDCSKVPCL